MQVYTTEAELETLAAGAVRARAAFHRTAPRAATRQVSSTLRAPTTRSNRLLTGPEWLGSTATRSAIAGFFRQANLAHEDAVLRVEA